MTQNIQEAESGAKAVKLPWRYRKPSLRRFIFWNILCWSFGLSALVGGTLYTEQIVRPVAEAGGTSFGPLDIFTKEEASKRVFGTTDRLNVLVVGLDYNYTNEGILYTKDARTDTIIVMSLSKDASYFNVVSVPRDTQVLIADDIGQDKINSAYTYGGIDQTRETVSNFLGIPIHHHVILKASGAADVIDALGGLQIDVEKDMDYDDNWGKLHIHLKKGPQVLNGEQAVGYARFRMDEEGDRGRIRRQQQVVRALGKKLKEPALLSRLDDLAKVIRKNLDTDLKLFQMVDLANLYSSFDFSKMRSAAIVGDDAMDANGVSYIAPYEPENRRTVRRLLQDLDWLRKDDLRIRIYYKKAPSSVAYDLADRLYDSGFRGVQVEEMPWDSPIPSEETRLVWYNEVPRLLGVINAVVGKRPSVKSPPPEGRDDDMAIYLGDQEVGNWHSVPEQLLKDRERLELDSDRREERRETRYHPEFIPRSLPQPVEEPQEFGPGHDFPESDDALQPNYPVSGGTELELEPETELETEVEAAPAPISRPERMPAPPSRPSNQEKTLQDTTEVPPPIPVEIDLSEPHPVATPLANPR